MRSPNTSTHWILVSESPRKAAVKHWMEHRFIPQRRGRTRSAPVVASSLPWPTGSPSTQHRATHSSCATGEGVHLLPTGTEAILGLIGCHLTHKLQQDKGVHIESETRKVLPTQNDKSSPSYGDSLSLGKEVFQTQG